MTTDPFDPDKLRPWDLTMLPDPRTTSFVKRMTSGEWVPVTTKDYHDAVAKLELNPSVPENIRHYYETARNLYLYAWYIYRFFPVAEQQALSCIEFALREHTQENEDVPKHKTLAKLLKYAHRQKLIRNEGFTVWKNRGAIRSRHRHDMELMKKMSEEDLDEIEVDYSNVEIIEEDKDFDYISALVETLPKIRNSYAHGTSTLHNQSLGTIQIACELVNQLYKD